MTNKNIREKVLNKSRYKVSHIMITFASPFIVNAKAVFCLMPRFDLVVVVPLYNEEGSLNRLKSEMNKFISDCRLSVYVLFR